MLRLAISLGLILSENVIAADAPCTQREEKKALATVSTLSSWNRVHLSYRRFSQCDDGAIGEGYSDVVTMLLANDWKHFNQFISLTNTDPQFFSIVRPQTHQFDR